MTGEWVVMRSWGHDPERPLLGDTETWPFDDERSARSHYGEMLKEISNGMPDGYCRALLSLEKRSISVDPRTGAEYAGKPRMAAGFT